MSESTTRDQLAEQADRLQSFAREGVDAINATKARVADKLHDVAGSVQRKASQVTGGRTVSDLADEATSGLNDAANYIRENEPRDMWRDVSSLVRSRPAQSLAAAAVLGFLLGRAARRG